MDLKALLIDQNLEDRVATQAILDELGFEVDLGITSIDAINALKSKEYDLVVCNNLMPTLNEGLTFVKHVVSNYKDLCLMICSSIKEIKILREFIEQGVSDYIIKPLDKDIFISKIAFRFDAVTKKEFASINISEEDSDKVCIVEVDAEVLNISELYLDLKVSDEIAVKTKLFIPGEIFMPMGIDKDNIEVEVVDVATDKIKCKYANFNDVELAMVRRWVLENYLL